MVAAKVNTESLKKLLTIGPMNILNLAAALGQVGNESASNPWELEKKLKDMRAGYEAMFADGNMDYIPFTVFPARERARYGFPDVIPVIKDEDPKRRRRAARNPNAKEQKQYWPIVAWGDIVPTETTGTETTYDGRHDEDIETIRQLLDEAGLEYLEIKGRMVRGGSGIYISLAKDSDTVTKDSVDVDLGGIVTNPEFTPVH